MKNLLSTVAFVAFTTCAMTGFAPAQPIENPQTLLAQSLSPVPQDQAPPGCITVEAMDHFMATPPGPVSVSVKDVDVKDFLTFMHAHKQPPAGFAVRMYLMNNFGIEIILFENGCALSNDIGSANNVGQ